MGSVECFGDGFKFFINCKKFIFCGVDCEWSRDEEYCGYYFFIIVED